MQKPIKIDLDTVTNQTVTNCNNIRKGDTLAITISVYENGRPLDVSTQTIKIILSKPDGTTYEKQVCSQGNIINAELDDQATTALGRVIGQIEIYDIKGSTITNQFIYTVFGSLASDVMAKSADSIQTLAQIDELIANCNLNTDTINQVTQMFENLNTTVTQASQTSDTLTAKQNDAQKVATNLDQKIQQVQSDLSTIQSSPVVQDYTSSKGTYDSVTDRLNATDSVITELKNKAVDIDTTGLAKQSDLNVTNAKLDDALNPLSVSFSINPSVVEMGSTVNSVVATWTCSKNVASQKFEGSDIDASLRTETYSTPLKANKTFTLVNTTAGGTSVTKTAALNFVNGVYYGKSSSVTYDSTLINSLTKILSDSKNRIISLIIGTGEYGYYIIPTRLGTPNFYFNGSALAGGMTKMATISFTNSSGYSENHDIYRTDYANLGTVSIEIK
jgi:predicted transcriptional regulator